MVQALRSFGVSRWFAAKHGVLGTLYRNLASAAHGARLDCTSAKPLGLSSVLSLNPRLKPAGECGILFPTCHVSDVATGNKGFTVV